MLKLLLALRMFGAFWGHLSQPEFCPSTMMYLPTNYSATPRERYSLDLLQQIGQDNNNHRTLLLELRDGCSSYRKDRAELRARIMRNTVDLSLTAECKCALSKTAPIFAHNDCRILHFNPKKKNKKRKK